MKVTFVILALNCFVALTLAGGLKEVKPDASAAAEKEQARDKRGGWSMSGPFITTVQGPSLGVPVQQIQTVPVAVAQPAPQQVVVTQPQLQQVVVAQPPPQQVIQRVAIAQPVVQRVAIAQPAPVVQRVAIAQPAPVVQRVAIAQPAAPAAVGQGYSVVYQTNPDYTYYMGQRHNPYYYYPSWSSSGWGSPGWTSNGWAPAFYGK